MRDIQKKEYGKKKVLGKRLAKQNKERVDEDFGNKIKANYIEEKSYYGEKSSGEEGGQIVKLIG